jgi:hypothetical protein
VNTNNEWRWADPLGQQRLVRTDELRAALAAGVIAPNTPVWKPGWKEWKPAYDVPELSSSALSNANGLVPNIPPPPLFIVAAQQTYEDATVPPDRAAVHGEPPPPPRYVPSATPPALAPIATVPAETLAFEIREPPNETIPRPAPSETVPLPVLASKDARPKGPPPKPTPVDRAASPDSSPPARSADPAQPSSRPPENPAKNGSFSKLRTAAPPPTKIGVGDPDPLLAGVPARPSSFPPDESGWDVGDRETNSTPFAVPAARPSETLAGGARPPKSGDEANTGVNISALSPADAERLLAIPVSHPTVHGVPVLVQATPTHSPALPPPPPLRPSSIPPTMAQAGGANADPASTRLLTPMYASTGVSVRSPTSKPPPRTTSRPPPPLRKRGHTLLLYGGAPHDSPPEAAPAPSESPPINVPSPEAQAPKAVTQSPPWIEGSATLDTTIPKAAVPNLPAMRPRADSIEEITGSVLLTEDSSADITLQKQKIEDLSDSYLLPADASGPAPAVPLVRQPAKAASEPPVPPSGAIPERTPPALPGPPSPAPPLASAPSTLPATQPSVADQAAAFSGELPLEPPPLPVAPPTASRRVLHDLNEMWAKPKEPWMIVVAVVGTLLVLALFVRVVAGAGSASKNVVNAVPPTPKANTGSPGEPKETAVTAVPAGHAGVPSASTVSPAVYTSTPSTTSATSMPSSTAPCTALGPAHTIAPKAHVRIGIESVAMQERLGLGFAIGDKEGMAVALDPTSLSATTIARQHTKEAVKRVVPVMTGSALTAVVDADYKAERVTGARSVADAAFVLGMADGKLVWATRSSDAPHGIWPLENDGPVEAIRAASLSDGGYAIAFRQGASIYVGTINSEKTAIGPLSRIAGLGSQIGSPALAASGDAILVVWADRAGTSDPWMLRLTQWQAKQPVGTPRVFPIPPGGLGEQAMSPGLTAVAGHRFLLSWTEGPKASHQVRAATLAPSGEMLGFPMTISAEGINAGQGQPAVLPDGKGLVAYMVVGASGTSAQVVATGVSCPLGSP